MKRVNALHAKIQKHEQKQREEEEEEEEKGDFLSK